MNYKILILILFSRIFYCTLVHAQVVSTFAGNGARGSIDSTCLDASFSIPYGVTLDAHGNIYIADTENFKIRKISPSGRVSTFAGSGFQGNTDSTGSEASFSYPTGVAVDTSGNVYVADRNNSLIRKISPTGRVSTFAGSGVQGSKDDIGKAASFNYPAGIAIDSYGTLYVADQDNKKIRKISPAGVVSTLAGSGAQGSKDTTIGKAASFYNPTGVAVDVYGNVYVADFGNNKIRKISPTGVVSTLAGSGNIGSTDSIGTAASFYNPAGVALDKYGNVYVADLSNQKIRKVSPTGVVSTLAGNGSIGSADSISTKASFFNPNGVTVDNSGNVYVADADNNKIRKIEILNSTTSIINRISSSNINIFPNPSSSFLYLQSDIIFDYYEIADLSGKVYYGSVFNTKTINISNLQTGIYLLKLTSNTGLYSVIKFLKE